MVDQRLKDIRTSSSAESSVNTELLDWLKNQGPNVLLIVLLLILGFRVWIWWGERQQATVAGYWDDLNNRDSAMSLLSLAEEAEGIGSLPEIAKLKAAEAHRRTLDQNVSQVQPSEETEPASIPDDPSATPPEQPKANPLTAEERADLLRLMENLYQEVHAATKDDPNRRLIALQAAFGMAAVAEMRGEYESAANWYTTIEGMALGDIEAWGRIAADRRESMLTRATEMDLPTDDESLTASGGAPRAVPPTVPLSPPAEDSTAEETPSPDQEPAVTVDSATEEPAQTEEEGPDDEGGV